MVFISTLHYIFLFAGRDSSFLSLVCGMFWPRQGKDNLCTPLKIQEIGENNQERLKEGIGT